MEHATASRSQFTLFLRTCERILVHQHTRRELLSTTKWLACGMRAVSRETFPFQPDERWACYAATSPEPPAGDHCTDPVVQTSYVNFSEKLRLVVEQTEKKEGVYLVVADGRSASQNMLGVFGLQPSRCTYEEESSSKTVSNINLCRDRRIAQRSWECTMKCVLSDAPVTTSEQAKVLDNLWCRQLMWCAYLCLGLHTVLRNNMYEKTPKQRHFMWCLLRREITLPYNRISIFDLHGGNKRLPRITT